MTEWPTKVTLLACLVMGCLVHGTTCALGTSRLKPVPTLTNYSSSGSEYDDGGMGALYNFARSFINTALPGDFPTQFINDTLQQFESGNMGIDSIKSLLQQFTGYVAAIAVGVLFIVFVPVVGVCFCCCRTCGNCGGSNKQEASAGMHVKRRVFAVVLFILTSLTLVGNICTYVSNGRMTVALDKIADTVDDNLDDVESYLDLVQTQVVTIGLDNLDITKRDILNFLDQTKLENEISTFVLDSLSNGALTKMQDKIKAAADAFDLVIRSKNAINKLWPMPGPNPVSGPMFQQLDNNKAKFDTFKSVDIVGKVKGSVITEIHTKLSGISAQRNTVTSAFTAIHTRVQGVVDQIKDFRSNAQKGFSVESFKNKARSYTDTAKSYDKYRYMAAAGLAGVTTLVVTLQYMGLAFGSIGQGWSTEPSERGCVSTAGGNFLMASVGFIFIFSSLLMLLTTICFSLGSILEKFMCQPLSDDDLSLLKVADHYLPTGSFLEADLSDIMKNCRADKSAYEAFGLKSKIDLNSLDSTLDSQKATIDQAMQNALSGLSSMGSVNMGGIDMNKLNDFQTSLSSLNFANMKQQIQSALIGVPVQMAPVRGAMQDMLTAINTLERTNAGLNQLSTDFSTGMNSAASSIGSRMTTLMQTFKTRIIRIAEEYVNSTKTNIKENMGRCSPVWNLYESILVIAVCKYTIDSFNGFWFSIGWCLFFFMPSTVFSVKLAKHYRKMNAPEGNKVGHLDDGPIAGY